MHHPSTEFSVFDVLASAAPNLQSDDAVLHPGLIVPFRRLIRKAASMVAPHRQVTLPQQRLPS